MSQNLVLADFNIYEGTSLAQARTTPALRDNLVWELERARSKSGPKQQPSPWVVKASWPY